MRFENKLESGITFYYELNGKQEGKLFVVRFSYGTTGYPFHEEITRYNTPEKMRIAVAELKEYVLKLNFIQVKKNDITKH
jgi:hypothetical protein